MLDLIAAARRIARALPKLPPKPKPDPAQPRIDAAYLRMIHEKEDR